ncbi:MAG: hypothetical protein ACK4NE_02530, partial [Albidovulum sp.]
MPDGLDLTARRPLRIGIVSQYFWPETFPINAMARLLAARGHHIEVLTGLPADLRDFLLYTSILERLSAPLCDAVTGRPGSARVL